MSLRTQKAKKGYIKIILVIAALVVAGLVTSTAQAQYRDTGCQTRQCVKRVKIHNAGFPFCNTWGCVHRVVKKRAERVLRAEAREMAQYKKSPLPWCTWGPESGVGNGEWSMTRYTMPNQAGGDGGGKFQIMLGTWKAHGGHAYSQNPIYAKPVYQERIARRVLAVQGLSAWVNC